jgi:hypothetical protein
MNYCETPVPVSVTLCGLPSQGSLTLSEPLRLPKALGVHVTLIVQDSSAARVEGQLFVWWKSPPMVMPVIFRAADVVFFNCTLCAALWVLMA